jgi:hypothetical protein
MSAPSAVGMAFVGVAVIQSGLAIWLDRVPITTASFRKVLVDQTSKHDIDGINYFFSDRKAGDARVDEMVRIGLLASRVTTQLAALFEATIGLLILAIIAFSADKGVVWKALTSAFLAMVLIVLVQFGDRVRKGTLRDFRLERSMGGRIWDTPEPYAATVAVLAIFAAIAVVGLG